jgi:hypothetical protein
MNNKHLNATNIYVYTYARLRTMNMCAYTSDRLYTGDDFRAPKYTTVLLLVIRSVVIR